MNLVIEEAMTNMIKRIDILEDKLSRISIPDKKGFYQKTQNKEKKGYKSGMATEGQLKYIKILHGETWDEMTKAEAGKEIDRLIKEKEKREVTKSHSESPKVDSQLMNQQDAEERADYEINKSKSLTQKEIDEVGEENLL